MDTVKRWAAWALLVALPMHARCVEPDAAHGPLTEAQVQQCQAQVDEYNDRAHAYNAKVAELKALRAEIALRMAELDKDRAAVNHDDPVAMDALNARIVRNNELIERHGQMTATLKEMAADNEQRAARFHAACEDRSPSPPAHAGQATVAQAPPSTAACSSATGAKDLQQRVDAALAEMREDEKRRQAEVSAVADARARAQSWSKERQGQVWLQAVASPGFMAFEREKQPYVQELMRIVMGHAGNARQECQLIQRIAATLPAIRAINAREYAFMADAIRAAK